MSDFRGFLLIDFKMNSNKKSQAKTWDFIIFKKDFKCQLNPKLVS